MISRLRISQSIQKHQIVFLLCLFFLSAFLRIYRFEDRMDWGTNIDLMRDIFVAEHAVKYGEFPIIGHINSGNKMFYPFFYYYFLITLAFFSPTYHGISLAIILFTATMPLWIYGIGKRLFSPVAGCISALLFTLSLPMIDLANVSSVNVGIPFFTAGVFFALSYDTMLRFLGYCFMAFSGTIHASGFVGMMFFYIDQLFFDTMPLKKQFFIGFGAGIYIIILFSFMIKMSGIMVLWQWFYIGAWMDVSQPVSIIHQGMMFLFPRFASLFVSTPVSVSSIGICAFFICLVGSIFSKKRRIFLILFLTVIVFFLFGATKKGEFQEQYFNFVYPFFFIGIGGVISEALKKRLVVFKVIGAICIISMIIPIIFLFTRTQTMFPFSRATSIVSAIIAHAQQIGYSEEEILITGKNENWKNPIDLFLAVYATAYEEMTGKKMAVSGLVRDGFHMPTYAVAKPGIRHVYYLCLSSDGHPERCIGDTYQESFVFVKEIEHPDSNIRVFLFSKQEE